MADDRDQTFKKVRKGTRSCQECRRRKKHCVWPADNSNVCTECATRNVSCQKQQVSSGKRARASNTVPQSLQDRVAQLEHALNRLNASEDGLGRLSSGQSDTRLNHSSSCHSSVSSPSSSQATHLTAEHDIAAGASLRGNPLVSDDQVTLQLDATCHKHVSPGYDALTREKNRLQAAFPPLDLIQLAIKTDCFAWQAYHVQFPPLFGVTDSYTFTQLVEDCMQGPSVAHIAKALLIVIISLQETSELSAYQNNLSPEDRQAIIDHGAQVVAEEVLSSDELCATLEGLECWLLQGKFDCNAGRIKKAWLDSRKSLALAQMCGFHRVSPSNPSDIVTGRKRAVWKCLYTIDRWTSLLAALPCCLTDSVAMGWDMLADSGESQSYYMHLAVIVGRIVERNQEPPSRTTLNKTLDIDSQFLDLAATKDAEWWKIKDADTIDPEVMTTRVIPQFWHHQARLLLHLPYMLQANHDSRFEHHRAITLESARKMIALFRRLRPAQGFSSHLCKIIDFQVFTAAMVLILNHHQTIRTGKPSYQTPGEESDQELLLATTAIMLKARTEIDEIVLKEATRALDIFNKTWDNYILPPSDGASPSKVFVPYFGTVILGPGGNITREYRATESSHSSPPVQTPTYSSPSPSAPPNISLPSTQPPAVLAAVTSPEGMAAPATFLHPTPFSADVTDPAIFNASMQQDGQQIPLSDFDVPMQGDGWGFGGGNFGNTMDMDLTRDWDWFWQNTQIDGLMT